MGQRKENGQEARFDMTEDFYMRQQEIQLYLHQRDGEATIRTNEYNQRQLIQNQRKLEYMRGKQFLDEERREREKSQFESMFVDDNGMVKVETQNLLTKRTGREITNFISPEIVVLLRLEKPEERIFLFNCEMDRKHAEVYFDPQKCGSGTYVLRKFAEIGAKIFAVNLAAEKRYGMALLTLLISNSTTERYLPERQGWFEDEKGDICFETNLLTWEEAKKCTE